MTKWIKMIEIAPFIWNKKDEFETNQPEVTSNVDNSYSKVAERLVFKISCVGPFGVLGGVREFLYKITHRAMEQSRKILIILP